MKKINIPVPIIEREQMLARAADVIARQLRNTEEQSI